MAFINIVQEGHVFDFIGEGKASFFCLKGTTNLILQFESWKHILETKVANQLTDTEIK